MKLISLVRKEIADLMEIGTTLHAWVKFSIPGRGREERMFEAVIQVCFMFLFYFVFCYVV